MDFYTLGTLLPRYFRVIGDASRDLSDVKIAECPVQRIPWTTDFYAIPGCTPLMDANEGHKSNGLYPMDVASAIAVMVLNPNPDEATKALDLCCCPGNKLSMIAERLSPESIVVGVDISESRLNVCRSLLRSWSERFARFKSKESARQLIFHGDGTEFSASTTGKLVYDSSIINEELAMFGGVRKRNVSYIKREQKRLKAVESGISSSTSAISDTADSTVQSELNIDNFDYVLVDAECTHDASYKHMQFIPADREGDGTDVPQLDELSSKKAFGKRNAALTYTTDSTGSQLRDLQRALLANGFRNLKPGGVLVYSTCSQAREQNEDIVSWFLESVQGQAELVSVLETLRTLLPPLLKPEFSNGAHADAGEKVAAFGTDEFCFDLSDSSSPLHLLQQEPTELTNTINTNYSTQEARRALAHSICDAVVVQARPAVAESELLPGAVKLSYKGGMSGHFIAKIQKLEPSS